jgi:dihydroxyacetone kinase-like protein
MSITSDDILIWLKHLAQTLHENRDYLTELDSAIGDADHGINMERGFNAVLDKLPSLSGMDIGTIFKSVGSTLISTVGGASGPLYGTAFLRAGSVSIDKLELDQAGIVAILEAALEGVKVRGKSQLGEKTMVDALTPALLAGREALAADLPLSQFLLNVARAAEVGMKNTIQLKATKGRASYLGERSIGHQDPGATSSWLILKALAEVSS